MPPLEDLDIGPRLDLGLGIRRPPAYGRLTPEQERGLGAQLLEAGKGGLTTALDTLAIPGDYARGLLAGRPGQRVTGGKLLEHYGVLPAGDRSWGGWGLGLAAGVATDPLTYLTLGAKHALGAAGRALMKQGHLQGWSRRALLEGYHGLESGMGAAAAQEARDVGRRIATPAAEAHVLATTGRPLEAGRALSGLARLSVPFRPGWGFNVPVPGRAARAVGGALDTAADALQFGTAPARWLGSLFDYRRGQAIFAPEQRAFVEAQPLKQSIRAAGEAQYYDTTAALDEVARDLRARGLPGHEAAIQRAHSIGVERTSPLAFLESATSPEERALYDDLLRRTEAPADELAAHLERSLHQGEALGTPRRALADVYARYRPREAYAAHLAGAGPQFERRTNLPLTSGSDFHRQEMFRDVPGGTDRLNDWAHRFAGDPDRGAVAGRILDDMVRDHVHVRGAGPSRAEFDAFRAKADELAEWASGLDAGTYRGAIATHPFFSHLIGEDILRHTAQQAKTQTAARVAVRGLAARAAAPGTLHPAVPQVPLTRALDRLGLVTRETPGGVIGAAPELYRALGERLPAGAPPLASLTAGPAAPLHAELARWSIPENSLGELAMQYGKWITPEEAVRPIKALDSITNAFKSLVYPIWPASHVRNVVSAYLHGLRTGTTPGDVYRQLRMMRGLEDPAAAHAMRRAQLAHAGISREAGPTLELAGAAAAGTPGAATGRTWVELTPGTTPHGLGRIGPAGHVLGDVGHLIAREGIGQHLADWRGFLRSPGSREAFREHGLSGGLGEVYRRSPYRLAGVWEAQQGGRFVPHADTFTPVAVGRKVGGNIEEAMRGAQFRGLLRQGYSPEMAGDLVRKYQFSYSDLTPFEKTWMRRLMPFYTFSRKNLPLQLETLATRPGAFAAPFRPMTAAQERFGDRDQFVPDYLARGFAMPLSPEVGGTQKFLTSLGLPQEEAMRAFQFRGGRPDLAATAMGIGGNLNPLLKGAVEQMTGTQLYSGRKLNELRPTAVGRGLAALLSDEYAQPYNPLGQYLTQFVANTPLSRFATTIDKLSDTQAFNPGGRKRAWETGLNLFTGARVSDVNMERQRYYDRLHAVQAALAGSPHVGTFVRYYPRPEEREFLTPEERALLAYSGQLERQAHAYLEQKRRRAGAP